MVRGASFGRAYRPGTGRAAAALRSGLGYRNLETLEEVGLVRHVHLGHGPGLYALAAPEHEYLVCESCHAVRTVAKGGA